MKILIIDNEKNIRESLVHMIGLYCPEIKEIHQADGVQTGIQKIAEQNPDLIFIDVEMDDGTGMDLLQQITQIDFQVIFITAHNKYAVDAFRFSAIDFLLKPIDSDDLIEAVKKVSNHKKNKLIGEQLTILQNNINQVLQRDKKIVLKDSTSIYFVPILDIIRCESQSQYTEFFLADKSRIVISKPLKEYEELLEPFGFIRPHHSHLINVHRILRFDKQDGGSLIMQNQEIVPVSQRKKADILNLLEGL